MSASSSDLVKVIVAGAATFFLVCALGIMLYIGTARGSSKDKEGLWKRTIPWKGESAARRGTMSIIGEDKYKIGQDEARQPHWNGDVDDDDNTHNRHHTRRQTAIAQPAAVHFEVDPPTPRNRKSSHSKERRMSGSVPDRVKEEDIVANLRISDTPALATTLRRHSEADVPARGLKRRISRGVDGSGPINRDESGSDEIDPKVRTRRSVPR
jgi:hypothetical protein